MIAYLIQCSLTAQGFAWAGRSLLILAILTAAINGLKVPAHQLAAIFWMMVLVLAGPLQWRAIVRERRELALLRSGVIDDVQLLDLLGQHAPAQYDSAASLRRARLGRLASFLAFNLIGGVAAFFHSLVRDNWEGFTLVLTINAVSTGVLWLLLPSPKSLPAESQAPVTRLAESWRAELEGIIAAKKYPVLEAKDKKRSAQD